MEQKQNTALAMLKNTTEGLAIKINQLVEKKELMLPQNYAVGNAIQEAQLILADKPDIIEKCTQASIYKSIKSMAIMGLSPSTEKQQVYFVGFGNQCTLMISYYGYVAIAKRIDTTIEDIIAHPIKKDEEFDFEIRPEDGYYNIIKHKPSLASMAQKECIGAYATIVYNDGKPTKSLVVSWDEIEQAWKMSKTRPFGEDGKTLQKGSTHYKFFNDMVRKTVTAKITKPIIRTADDKYLFGQTVKAVDLNNETAQADAAISEAVVSEATGEIIDTDYEIAEE